MLLLNKQLTLYSETGHYEHFYCVYWILLENCKYDLIMFFLACCCFNFKIKTHRLTCYNYI